MPEHHEKTENEARKNEQRLNLALKGANVFWWEWNIQTGEVMPEGHWAGMLGYSLENDITNFSALRKLVHPDDVEYLLNTISYYLEGKTTDYICEYRLRDATDQWRWIHSRGSIVEYDNNGAPLKMTGVDYDFTDCKQIEEALRDSEERYRLLFDKSESLISVYDIQGVCLMMNEKVARCFGGSPEQFVGKSFADLYTAEADEYTARIAEVIKSGAIKTYEDLVDFPGGKRWLSSGVYPVRDSRGRIYAAQIISQDITERKRTEQALRENEARFRSLFEQAGDGLLVHDLEGNIVDANQSMCKLFGYTKEEFCGLHFSDSLPSGAEAAETVRRAFQKLGREGHVRFETEFVSKSGVILNGEVTASLVEVGGNKLVHTVFRDITERKRAGELLEENKRILDATGKMGKIGGWEHDLRTGRAVWTQALYDIIEIPYQKEPPGVEEHLGYYPPKDREILERAYNRSVKNGIPFDLELQVYTSKKRPIWCRAQGEPVYEDGKCVAMRGIFQDITVRKQAEEALQERERFLNTLLDAIPIPVFYKDRDGRYLGFNKAFETIFGETKKRLIGQSVFDANPPELAKIYQAKDRELFESGGVQQYESQVENIQNGELRDVIFNRAVFTDRQGAVIGLIGTILDITERKQVEQALLDSETRFRQIFENIGEGIAIYEAAENGNDFIFKDINPAGARIGQKPRKEHIGKSLLDVYPGVRDQGLFDVFREVWRSGVSKHHPISLYKDERISYWVENYVSRLPSGEIMAVYEDASARKKAEEALRQSEKRLIEAQHIAKMGDFIWDIETGTVTWSDALFSLLQYDKSDQVDLNKVNTEIHHPDDLERVTTWLMDSIAAGKEVLTPNEYRLIRKDGEVLFVQTKGQIEYLNGKPMRLFGTCLDITSLKRTEEEREKLQVQLRRAQKLEAIGSLAGGIAHDFNNILAAIIGYTEIALFDLPESEPINDNLQNVLKASDRAKDLVQQILTFSGQAEKQFSPVDVAPIVRECLKFLRSTLPTTIDILQEIQEIKGSILGDPIQLHQVVMNLCTNAAQALGEDGGVLEVKLNNLHLDSCSYGGELTPGNYVKLVVSDTGQGMEKSTMEKIYDPYFTTKPRGEGTGLGLSVVHGIVKEHGGVINVYSEVGVGTTFNVYFPQISNVSYVQPDGDFDIPTGHEKILLIDDETALVDIGRGMLERLGYSVDTQTDSREALEIFRSSADKYDLIITDQTMPHMTGIQLAQQILRIRPDMPIILCTGFSYSVSAQKVEEVGIKDFLMKPIVLSDLASSVRAVLDEKDRYRPQGASPDPPRK